MPSTSQKIRIARGLSAAVRLSRGVFGLPPTIVCKRRGLKWSLDLREGIDLAIYVLGGFEVRTLRRYASLIKPGDVVLDIGANVGAHTLPLADLVGPAGKVISFEPTAYAFAKQQVNIGLNPHLASRIHAFQTMLMASDDGVMPDSVYSSWPLAAGDDLHPEHHGRLMTTQGAVRGTLDSFLRAAGITRIDFIKLDVDGNEADVLRGATHLLGSSRPSLMLELAPYVYRDDIAEFDGLLEDLWRIGYQISDVATGRPLPRSAAQIRRLIPDGGGLNVLARYPR